MFYENTKIIKSLNHATEFRIAMAKLIKRVNSKSIISNNRVIGKKDIRLSTVIIMNILAKRL